MKGREWKAVAMEMGLAPARDQLEAAWESVRAGLRRDVGARLYDQWIRALALGAFCPVSGSLDLEAPSDFSANYVSGNFASRICLAWRAAQVGVRDVRVVRAKGAAESVAVAPLPEPETVLAQDRRARAPVRAAPTILRAS